MMQFVRSTDPGKVLRLVLVAQVAVAGFLILSDTVGSLSLGLQDRVDLPSTPVTPGDQRRQYRTDRTLPDLVTTEDPLEFPMPEEFPDRLAFSESTVEGFGKVLLVSGQIEEGDSERFENYLSDMQAAPDLIALHSPGGMVFEALRIGRTIREQELSTSVLTGAFCMSSCPYVLAGGVARSVSLNGVVGLHQHYYEQPKYMPVVFAVEDIQAGQGETMEYLIEMGVDTSVMLYSLKTPPDQIYALVESELVETQIATEIIK